MVIYDRKISVKIDGPRLEALKEYAKKEGVPVSTLIRHLVCRFLESQQRFAPSMQHEVRDGF